MKTIKKILQSILLLLLFLATSSNLFAQTYKRSTGGSWNDKSKWNPRGVPNGKEVRVELNNTEIDSLSLNLDDKRRTVKILKISGNAAWNLFKGILAFRTAGSRIIYDGTRTFTLATALDLDFRIGTELNVSEANGTVRLLGPILGGTASNDGFLTKKGPGTLLIEASYSADVLRLRGGTVGVAPGSFDNHSRDYVGFYVLVNSNLFALNGDINMPGLYVYPDTDLNIIDTPYSITFRGYKFGSGTINQLSHGDLIFEDKDDFEGTIHTQTGYGRIILNGDTRANIQMDGGEITGSGKTRGNLTAENGAIINPSGRLSVRNMFLDPSTTLNFKFNNATNDLIHVDKNLTLAGTLRINAAPGFEDGVYRLFNYGGKLINNGLSVPYVPDGYDATVQTAIPSQVNLVITPSSRTEFSTIQFWDDGRTVADGKILGGDGAWNNTDKTWSSIDGLSKNTWNGYKAVFGGNAGIVDVQDNFSFREIEFITDSYMIHSSNNSKLLANDQAIISVDSTDKADIGAEITGAGSITKDDGGTLTLSHDNSYTGGTVLNAGTLVADTSRALSSSLVTLQAGLLRLGKTHLLQVGSYTQQRGATLALRANPTNHDLLMVNGNATLGGTLLLLQKGKGRRSNFSNPTTLITTTQGLNASHFDDIQLDHTSLKRLFVSYDVNDVYVTSHFDPIYPYAISRNAQALARNLDLFSNTGRNQNLFDSLANLNLSEVPLALEKLVPSQIFALSSIGLSVSRSQMGSLQNRLDDLSLGYTSYGKLNTNPSHQYGLALVGVPTQANFLMNKEQALWNFYMRGNGSFGRQSQDNESEIPGYDYGQGGTFIGADYPINDKIYLGGAVSYTYTDTSFHNDRGSLSTNSYFGHLYAAYAQPKGFNLISSLSFGDHEFDFRRRALTDIARSQPRSMEVDFQSQVSYNIPLRLNLTVSPYAGLAYSAFWMNRFQEYNSEASLKISDDQTDSLRSIIGAKAKYEKFFTKSIIQKASVEANLAWSHEYFGAQSQGINAEWVGSKVPSFHVQGGRLAADTLISGVNLRFGMTNLISVISGYNIEANRGYITHNFDIGVNLTF
jgi:autotransporter-associated beta strand protein